MTSKEPKGHHFIPRFLLSNFENDDGKLCLYFRGSEKIAWRSSGKVAKKRNLYKIRETYEGFRPYTWSEGGEMKNKSILEMFPWLDPYAIEKKLSELEGKSRPLVMKIHGGSMALEPHEREILSEFFAILYLRSLHCIDAFKSHIEEKMNEALRGEPSDDFIDSLWESMTDDNKKRFGTKDQYASSFKDFVKRRFGSAEFRMPNPFVSILQRVPNVKRDIFHAGWMVVHSTFDQFIMPDTGGVHLRHINGRTEIGHLDHMHPESHFLFPLSSAVLLIVKASEPMYLRHIVTSEYDNYCLVNLVKASQRFFFFCEEMDDLRRTSMEVPILKVQPSDFGIRMT